MISLEEALATGKKITLDVKVIRKDGTIEEIPDAATLVKNAETGEYEQIESPIFPDASGDITNEDIK